MHAAPPLDHHRLYHLFYHAVIYYLLKSEPAASWNWLLGLWTEVAVAVARDGSV
ncbi:hypothetical protein BC939DRAFT_443549 [Gamsiella multidivaricata]|uniref:uncharacterized protein n=1 Tax=Gamsiella multidivaricata TaxID=101098 RepID=UPI00221F199E|nr:uncharacterized protein BC939DRAFT_443549 [Gamsiella multidivaricata]KAI7828672.1 hypothetical protein BC939DRAFT_443549 [Gamsiella multidivaricata]